MVLEALRIGFGASGAMAAACELLQPRHRRDLKSYGMDIARMLGSMMFEGGGSSANVFKCYQIDGDYRPGGLFVAMNDKQLATLEEQKENWNATAINSWNCWTPTPFAVK
ncbi:hypothetical protein ACLK19_08870 [Escherichia coli]